MISGYLLLDREYSGEQIKDYYSKRYIHLLIVVIIWLGIYSLYYSCSHSQLKLFEFVRNMMLVNNVNYNKVFDHTWYLYKLLGIYLIIPLLSIGLNKIKLDNLKIPFVILVLYNFIIPTLSVFYKCLKGRELFAQSFNDVFVGFFGMYVIFGYLIKKNVIYKKVKDNNLLLTGLICLVLIILMQLYSYSKGVDYNVWYDNFFLLLGSSCIFALISRKTFNSNKIVNIISKFSFPIYLIHKIILDIFGGTILNMNTMMSIKTIVLFIIMFAISFIVSVAMSLIPKIGKYMIYIK